VERLSEAIIFLLVSCEGLYDERLQLHHYGDRTNGSNSAMQHQIFWSSPMKDDIQYLDKRMGKNLHPLFQEKLNAGIKYLFVDFDGTVRQTVPDPTEKNPKDRRPPFKVEEIKIIPGIADKLKKWKEKGWLIVGVSNQSGIEKGLVTEETVKKVADETMNRLGIHFPFYFAPQKYKGDLLYLRKPNTGMAELAFKEYGPPNLDESFVVGDYISDRKFAENLGMKYVDVDDFIANY
jgi:D-glycero-D-manno-heptose 1,7-bisphosphate phosphatase